MMKLSLVTLCMVCCMVNGDLSDLFTPQNVMNAIVLNALLPNGLTGPSSPGGSSSGNGGNSMSGGAPGISLDNEPVAGFMPFADQSSGPGASRDRKPTGARRRGGNTGAAGNTQYCCYWATAGECDKNPTWMKVNCQKACGTSSATAPTMLANNGCPGSAPISNPIPTATTTPTTGNTANCCQWASSGECDKNPYWMKINCQQACGTPTATVVNAATVPTALANNGCGGSTPTTNPVVPPPNVVMSAPPPSAGPSNTPTVSALPMGAAAAPAKTDATNTSYITPTTNTTVVATPASGNAPTAVVATPTSGNAPPTAVVTPTSGNAPTSAAAAIASVAGACTNSNDLCNFWASVGECTKNAQWMSTNCQQACTKC